MRKCTTWKTQTHTNLKMTRTQCDELTLELEVEIFNYVQPLDSFWGFHQTLTLITDVMDHRLKWEHLCVIISERGRECTFWVQRLRLLAYKLHSFMCQNRSSTGMFMGAMDVQLQKQVRYNCITSYQSPLCCLTSHINCICLVYYNFI